MSSRTDPRGYLACEQDGSERATAVCGQCGSPVCSSHSATVVDPLLTDYQNGGKTLLGGLTLVVLVPVLVEFVPRVFWLTLADLAGKALYLQGSLQLSAIIIGITLLGSLHGRKIDSGFKLLDFEILTSKNNARTVCESCYRMKRQQKYVGQALGVLALVLIGYGLYRSLPALFFQPLWIAAVGGALWLVRYKIVGVLFAVLQESESAGMTPSE